MSAPHIKQAASIPAPIQIDVNTLIDSIRQFPDLVHKGEPGFAESFQNPNTKELLWRSSALLPIGLSAAGLLALGSGRKDIKPLPPKQVAISKKKKAPSLAKAADWQETFQNVKAQLPGLHPIDTAAGALGGAALGGLYDVLRGNSEKLAPNKRWKSTARRVLGGALLGGGAANLAGDRARRYISNTLMPFGYDPSAVDAVKPTWKKVWQAGVLDKPTYSLEQLQESSDRDVNEAKLDARREIMRRTFGVHANNPVTDWWQKNKGGYYSLNEKNPEYAKRLRAIFGPQSDYKTHTMYSMMSNPDQFLSDFNTKKIPNQSDVYDFFSGWQMLGDQQLPFAKRGPRFDGQVLDRFDITPNPKEVSHLKQWVTNQLAQKDPAWNSRRMSEEDLKGFDYAPNMADRTPTNSAMGKSVLGRWLWDNVLSEEKPWISQKFTLKPNEIEQTIGNMHPRFGQPPPAYQFEFLNEAGKTVGKPFQSETDLNEWVRNNPMQFGKLQRLIDEAKKQQAEKKGADTNINWANLLGAAARGGVAGSVLGGLQGVLMPGRETVYDEHGRATGTKQRNRLAAGLRGAVWSGLGGAGLGAAGEYFSPGLVKAVHDASRRFYTGKTQRELNISDNVAKLPYPQQQTHQAIMARQKYLRENPAPYVPPKYNPGPQSPAYVLEPEPWESGRQMTEDELIRSEDANL